MHKDTYNTLEAFATDALTRVQEEDKEEALERVRKYTQALRYYRGIQRGFYDENSGDFVPLDWTLEKDGRAQAILLSDNIFRPQMKALIKEWSRSRTTMRARARGNSRKSQAAAQFAAGLIELLQDRIQNESFRQQEGRWAVLTGNYFRHTAIVKDNLRSPKIEVPVLEAVVVNEAHYSCEACELDFPEAEVEDVCPNCGGQLEYSPAFESHLPLASQQVPVGEVTTMLVDPRAVKIPLSTREMKYHSYLLYTQIEELGRLRRLYNSPDLQSSVTSEASSYILATEASSGASDVSNGDYAGNIINKENRAERHILWLTPDFYFGVVVEDDYSCEGFTLQGGVPLDEQFPTGICLHVINNKLYFAEVSALADCWAQGTYDELAETPYGDGNDDAILDQNRYNELRAMEMENALFNSFSKTVINPALLDPTLIENNTEIIPLNQNAHYDPANKLEEVAFATIPSNTLSAEVYGLRVSIEQSMRAKTGAHLTMSGENDPDVKTATGMSILRDSAVATLALALALRSEVDVEWAYQCLEATQKNWVEGFHDKLLGDFSSHNAKAFRSCDIRNEISITVQANSWIPRTEEQVRMDFLEYLTAGGLPLGFANPEVPLEIRQVAADIYRAPVDLDKVQPDVRIASMRLDKLIQLASDFPRPQVPEEELEEAEQALQEVAAGLAGQIPVRLYVDEHQVIANEYKRWLKTDEGIEAHRVLQDAVEILIQRHRDAEKELAMEAMMEGQEAAMMAQPPAPPEEGGQEVGQPSGVSPQMPGYEQGKGSSQESTAVPG